ncbi:unannotated protein [freshwater metagenome]|uniref:Unannotated protein n=1 Tax=freshwater metagenome TaxID=449393 RepID=A0A6J7DUX4_9ZZZZ
MDRFVSQFLVGKLREDVLERVDDVCIVLEFAKGRTLTNAQNFFQKICHSALHFMSQHGICDSVSAYFLFYGETIYPPRRRNTRKSRF